MTPEAFFARLDAALEERGEPRHDRSPCPDCGDQGPHADNGESGVHLSFSCRSCGMCFDAYDWP